MGWSSGDSLALRSHGKKAILAEHYPEGAFPVNYAMKDLDYALELAAEAGIDAAGADLVKALFNEAIEGGLGARYHPIIATLIDRVQFTRPGQGVPGVRFPAHS